MLSQYFGVRSRMNTSFPVLAFLLSLTLKGVFGINCFQCNSYLDSQCLELKTTNTTSTFYRPCEVDSEGRKPFCRKIDLKIGITGERRVVRTCGWEAHPSLECYKIEDDDHSETICQCFTDGCNAAPILANNNELCTVVVLVISFIITKLLAS